VRGQIFDHFGKKVADAHNTAIGLPRDQTLYNFAASTFWHIANYAGLSKEAWTVFVPQRGVLFCSIFLILNQ